MTKKIYLFSLALVAIICFAPIYSYAKDKQAKYVFYFIGDGMGVNQVNGTEMYMGELEGIIGTKPLCFASFPVATVATSYSAFNGVTDSAAGGTALATGEKTKNHTIGMDKERKEAVYSVAAKAKQAGKKVGITTSVSIDHATPASFYAHQPERHMYYEIACEIPKAGFDFYAGSGFIEPVSKKDPKAVNVYDLLDKNGYIVAKGYNEFNNKYAKASKMIMTATEDANQESIPFAIDRKPGDLTLSQITESAIRFLTKDNDGKGFFLMVEGGKIDWACHGNDAATAFKEVMDMDEAVRLAYDFYKQHPDETLIVITADHETGGIVLGKGPYELNLKALANQKVSQGELSNKIGALRKAKSNKVSWEDIQALLKENMGFWDAVQLNEKQEKRLKDEYERSFAGKAVELKESEYFKDEPMAAVAKEILNDIALVGWVSGGHSDGYVPVFAVGAGSDLFHGRMDNTDIPKNIIKAAGY